MIIRAIADIHGFLPQIEECDILLIAGDVCPMTDHSVSYQTKWLNEDFTKWLKTIPAQEIVGIGGNHDFALERYPEIGRALPWHYLIDEQITLNDTTIWGHPWTPSLTDWAFYLPYEMMKTKTSEIKTSDILLSHAPLRGVGDLLDNGLQVGCANLKNELGRVNPQSFICGHIHEGRGYYKTGTTDIYNVSYTDKNYLPQGPPVLISS
jgi:Icc-related predicted phosphoesterase